MDVNVQDLAQVDQSIQSIETYNAIGTKKLPVKLRMDFKVADKFVSNGLEEIYNRKFRGKS